MGELRWGVQNATLKETKGTQKTGDFAENGKLHKNHRAFSGSVSVKPIMTYLWGKRKYLPITAKSPVYFQSDWPRKVAE